MQARPKYPSRPQRHRAGVKTSGDLPPAGPMPSVIGGDVSIDGNTSGSTALHLERTQVKASNGLSLIANGGSLLLQAPKSAVQQAQVQPRCQVPASPLTEAPAWSAARSPTSC